MSSAFRFGLAKEFFQGFANEARCNLHLELLYGEEPHHVVEGFSKPLPEPLILPAKMIHVLRANCPAPKENCNRAE